MKLEKIEREMQRTREKIAEYQNRLKELDAQKTEQENLQIIQLVRAMRLSPQELTEFLQRGAVMPAPAAIPYHEQEDSEDEE